MTSSRASLRVAVVHGDLGAAGGAESYAHAVIDAICELDYDVTIYDYERFLGQLESAGRTGSAMAHLLGRLRGLETLTYAIVLRWFSSHVSDHDAAVFTYGECGDVPLPHVRILHAPAMFSLVDDDLRVLGVDVANRSRRAARRAYVRVCRLIGRSPGTVGERCRLTIVNSRWTRQRVAVHSPPGSDIVVVYPPVRRPSDRGHPRDANLVAMIGRLVPNKRHHDATAVVDAAIRLTGRPLRLVIAGRGEGSYVDELVETARHHDHLELRRDLSDPELDELLGTAMYGLHMYEFEHFGIAVGEMILAGCLPLVHDAGGVTELVTDRRCRFENVNDAGERLAALVALTDEERSEMTASLQGGAAIVESLDFERRIRHHLDRFLESIADRRGDLQNS